MMQHVHAGADRLCRERYGAAFERVGCTHVGAAFHLGRLHSASICLRRYLGASLWQNTF